MKLKELVNSILYSASSRAKTSGNLLFQKGFSSNIKGKKIDGIYHLYGKVSEENKDYNSHIKVDIAKGKVIGSSCTCEEYYENSKFIKNYICKHNIATTYMFYSLAKKRIATENKSNKKVEEQEEFEKENLKLDIKIKQVKVENHEFYETEFRVGKSNTYLINSLEEFISKREALIPYPVNQQFIYFPKRSYFSKHDEEVLKFISEYIKLNRLKSIGTYKKVDGKILRILSKEIKNLLKFIENNKKIIFNYEYLEYASKVVKEDLPIGFTLKLLNEKIVLRTKVSFPIPLNELHEAYFYDRKLYIPSEKQVKYYKNLYVRLKNDGEIKFEKSIEVVQGLINTLNNITENVILDEGVRRLIEASLTPKFYFDKVGNTLLCKVEINYGGSIVDILKDTNNSFLRDFNLEDKIDRELERLSFIKKEKVFIFVGSEEEVFDLLSFGLRKLGSIGSINLSKSFKEIKIINSSLINAEIMEMGEELYLEYNTDVLNIRDFKSALSALKDNKRFYKTDKNDFLDLKDPETISFLNIVDLLQLTDDDRIKIDKNKAIFLEDSIKSRHLEFIRDKAGLSKIKDKLSNRDSLLVDVPKDLNATLRNYQVIGFNWLNTLGTLGFGGILADEMGLGKTIQTIAFLLSNKGSKSIVITPTSLIYNWKEEFEKFAPGLSVGLIHGSTSRNTKVIEKMDEYDVILTTYGTLRNNIENYKSKYFKFCIIDEAQNIKNSKAQITNIVKEIKGECKIALTGTPMENNLIELWSIFDFVMPGFLFNENKFKEKFIINGDKGLDELKTLINPFILRREKKDVLLDLPNKIEKKSLVEMTSSQKRLYKAYMKEIKKKLKTDKENRIAVFSYLTKLRQLCLDPSLLVDGYSGGSGKLNEAMRITKEAIESGRKILLFSQFTSALNKIGESLSIEGIDYLYLDGSTLAKERVNLVKKFNEGKDIKVFLISLKAGGTGLNLTSANVVIHFDPWWNPAIEDQATDRAHRIGQKNVVEVIKLISNDTIEEKIVKLQEDKKNLINRVMNGEDMDGKIISRLTNEEVIGLFN